MDQNIHKSVCILKLYLFLIYGTLKSYTHLPVDLQNENIFYIASHTNGNMVKSLILEIKPTYVLDLWRLHN